MRRYVNALGLLFLLPLAVSAEPLDLMTAMKRAAEVSLSAVRSRERLRQSVSRAEEAKASLLPRVDAQVSQFRQTRNLEAQGITIPRTDPLVGPFNSFDARVLATLPLFDLDARRRFDQAAANLVLAEHDEKLMRQDTMLMGASLYLALKRAESAVAMTSENARWAQSVETIVRSRFNSGAASRLERDRAQSNRVAADTRAGETKVLAEERRRDLCVALQYSSDCRFEILETDILPTISDSSGTVSSIDVERARAALAEREANLQRARSGRMPRLSVAGDYGASGKDPGDVEATYAFGARASMPLYDAGRTRSQRAAAASAVSESEAALRDAQRQSASTIETARATVLQREAEWRSRRQEFEVASSEWETAQKSHEAGSVSAVDVLAARSRMAMARDALNAADAAYKLSILQWARSEGRLEELVKNETN